MTMEQLTALFEPYTLSKGRGLEAMGVVPFLTVLALALICGLIIAALYRRFYARRETGSQIQRAFPLLSLAITAIFVCIQFSLPLSLGLLGALSIVRFRTPIKEPEEIGFLMVVIATSLACATFNFKFLAVILFLTLVALILQEAMPRLLRGGSGAGVILISMTPADYADKASGLMEILGEAAPRGGLESLSEDTDEVVLTYGFRDLSASGAAALKQSISSELSPNQLTISFERDTGA